MINFLTLEFVFGMLATLLIIVGMFLRTRENILLLKIASDVAWVLAFAVQGAYSGTISMIFTALRTFFGRNFIQYKFIGLVLWFISVALTLIFWIDYFDLFAILGLSFSTISVYSSTPFKVKFYIMLAALSWCFYGYFIEYYALILFEAAIVSAGFVNMFMFEKGKKRLE